MAIKRHSPHRGAPTALPCTRWILHSAQQLVNEWRNIKLRIGALIREQRIHSPKIELLPFPLDVSLWWAYFNDVVERRPFVRLGATCVLENLSAGVGDMGHQSFEEAPFLNEMNTRFLQIHFHAELPHNDQIVAALESLRLGGQEVDDLIEGVRVGATMYLLMARWAMGLADLANRLNFALEDSPPRQIA